MLRWLTENVRHLELVVRKKVNSICLVLYESYDKTLILLLVQKIVLPVQGKLHSIKSENLSTTSHSWILASPST